MEELLRCLLNCEHCPVAWGRLFDVCLSCGAHRQHEAGMIGVGTWVLPWLIRDLKKAKANEPQESSNTSGGDAS